MVFGLFLEMWRMSFLTEPSLIWILASYGTFVLGYGWAGHYYTVYWLSLASGLNPRVAFRNAFFAQMPDQVTELDAIVEGVKTIGGWAFGLLPWPPLRSPRALMDRFVGIGPTPVQDYYHALTGDDSLIEQARTARALAEERPGTALFGSLSHRYGDCFSHRQIGNEGSMYKGARGHATDMSEPDRIHKRKELYVQYCQAYHNILSGRSDMEVGPRFSDPQITAGAKLVANSGREMMQVWQLLILIDEIFKSRWQNYGGSQPEPYRPESEFASLSDRSKPHLYSKTAPFSKFVKRHPQPNHSTDDGTALTDASFLKTLSDQMRHALYE